MAEKRNKLLVLVSSMVLVICQLLSVFLHKNVFLNDKMFFGLLGNNILSVLLTVVAAGILFFFTYTRRGARPFLALILAGAISNLLDRLLYGGVVDYINIFQIPAFNLADILIVLGAAIITLDLIVRENKKASF